MTWAVAAVAGATLVSGYLQSQATQNAANTQANAAMQQQGNLLAAGQQASQQFTPYANYGTTALSNLTGNNAYFNNQFNNQDLNAQLAPNYAFQLQQGQAGQNAAANATGGLVGGNAQKALQDYTQNYAGTAYQNAFNNYQTQRGNINAMNMSGANLGIAGATGSANAQLGTATNIANIGIGSANAQAASQIAQGNIYGGAANTLGNIAYMGAQNYSQANPYSNMGLSGSNGAGFTYNTQVGPTPSGGNLSSYNPG
jgi:hypothetical protein